MDRHPLESSYTKLVRAKHHIRDLEDRFRTFIETEGEEPIHDKNLETGVYRYLMRVPSPPTYLGAVVGDFIHNARSALDNLTWELVLRNRRGVEPEEPREIAFPVRDCETRFWKHPVLRFLTYDQRAIMQTFQPYFREHGEKRVPLGFLEAAWNEDKHRSVIVLAQGLREEDAPTTSRPIYRKCGALLGPPKIMSAGFLKDGAVLAEWRFTWLRPDSRVDMDIDTTVHPAFEDGTLLFAAMWKTFYEVRRIIRAFQDFFPPMPSEEVPIVSAWDAEPGGGEGVSTVNDQV